MQWKTPGSQALLGLALAGFPGALVAQDVIPADWTWRLDKPQQLTSGQEVSPGDWRYTAMPPGWHLTTTEQGVTLLPKGRALSGRWAIETELFLFPNPSDAPFGVVVESTDSAQGPLQVRFLMRRDGNAAVAIRHGARDTLFVPWRADTGVQAYPGSGTARYVLRVSHDAGTIAFAINGTEMATVPTAGNTIPVIPGFRLGPGLNVHVSRFDLITPLAPARPRRPG